MGRSVVLTGESALIVGVSATEPIGHVTGGTLEFEDGRTVQVGLDLVRLLNVLLSRGRGAQTSMPDCRVSVRVR